MEFSKPEYWHSLSLLQGIFTTQGSNPGLPHCRRILYHLSHQGSPRILEWEYPLPGYLPDPGIKPGSPALQADSLLSEPPGKPHLSKNLFQSDSAKPKAVRSISLTDTRGKALLSRRLWSRARKLFNWLQLRHCMGKSSWLFRIGCP